MTLDNVIAGKNKEGYWMLVSQDFRSMQGIEASDNSRKIVQLAPNIFFAGSGSSGTSYEVVSIAERDIAAYKEPTVQLAMQAVYRALQQEIDIKTLSGRKRTPTESLNVHTFVAGIDAYGPAIYIAGADATGYSDMFRSVEPFFSVGSGRQTAYPTIKRWVEYFGGRDYRTPCAAIEGMSIEDGIDCLTYAHLEAADFTPTVSKEFEAYLLTIDKSSYKIKEVDSLPLEKMRKELNADRDYFISKRRGIDPTNLDQVVRVKPKSCEIKIKIKK